MWVIIDKAGWAGRAVAPRTVRRVEGSFGRAVRTGWVAVVGPRYAGPTGGQKRNAKARIAEIRRLTATGLVGDKMWTAS